MSNITTGSSGVTLDYGGCPCGRGSARSPIRLYGGECIDCYRRCPCANCKRLGRVLGSVQILTLEEVNRRRLGLPETDPVPEAPSKKRSRRRKKKGGLHAA